MRNAIWLSILFIAFVSIQYAVAYDTANFEVYYAMDDGSGNLTDSAGSHALRRCRPLDWRREG